MPQTGSERLAEDAMKDTDYVSMVHALENGTIPRDLPDQSELKQMEGVWSDLSVFTLKNLVPRIQNSRFWLTSDNITTPIYALCGIIRFVRLGHNIKNPKFDQNPLRIE